MASQGEAYANFIGAVSKSRRGIGNDIFKVENTQRKMRKASGRGRGLGGLLGAVIGTMIAPGIGTAIGAGLGSRAGSEIGERSVKGKKKLSKDRLFGKSEIRNRNKAYSQYYSAFNKSQNVNALTDAISGYLAAGKIASGIGGVKSAFGFLRSGGSPVDILKMLSNKTAMESQPAELLKANIQGVMGQTSRSQLPPQVSQTLQGFVGKTSQQGMNNPVVDGLIQSLTGSGQQNGYSFMKNFAGQKAQTALPSYANSIAQQSQGQASVSEMLGIPSDGQGGHVPGGYANQQALDLVNLLSSLYR